MPWIWKWTVAFWKSLKGRRWGLGAVVTAIALTVVVVEANIRNGLPAWTGFGEGESVSVTTHERDTNGNITKTVTTTPEPGKTLWDWLSLLGVPLSLAILGFWFQQQEQKRTDDETKEEVLQGYFDRVSALLVDKNLLAIAAKIHTSNAEKTATQPKAEVTLEERELLHAAVDVIRARTLSILRRFKGDADRKASVMWFLIETEVIDKAKLSLKGADLRSIKLKSTQFNGVNFRKAKLNHADLSSANLSYANLSHANLSHANLSHADLFGADLSDANLSSANFSDAELSHANLSDANLSNANLSGTYLIEANLFRANLSGTNLTGAYFDSAELFNADLSEANFSNTDLSSAKLCRTKLPRDCSLDPNRDCQEVGIDPATGDPVDSNTV